MNLVERIAWMYLGSMGMLLAVSGLAAFCLAACLDPSVLLIVIPAALAGAALFVVTTGGDR